MIRQLSIGARASAAFGLIGILTLILGIFALNRMGAIETQLNIISDKQVPSVDNVNDLDRELFTPLTSQPTLTILRVWKGIKRV